MKRQAKLVTVLFLFVVVALLVGCGTSAAYPVRVESAEELVGTWESACMGPGCNHVGRFQYFDQDGTFQWGSSLEALEMRIELGRAGEFWFESARYHTSDPVTCRLQPPGVYEVQFVEEGKALFTALQDDCEGREEWLVGDGSEPMVWTRVE